jgi:hypothetical protein
MTMRCPARFFRCHKLGGCTDNALIYSSQWDALTIPCVHLRRYRRRITAWQRSLPHIMPSHRPRREHHQFQPELPFARQPTRCGHDLSIAAICPPRSLPESIPAARTRDPPPSSRASHLSIIPFIPMAATRTASPSPSSTAAVATRDRNELACIVFPLRRRPSEPANLGHPSCEVMELVKREPEALSAVSRCPLPAARRSGIGEHVRFSTRCPHSPHSRASTLPARRVHLARVQVPAPDPAVPSVATRTDEEGKG